MELVIYHVLIATVLLIQIVCHVMLPNLDNSMLLRINALVFQVKLINLKLEYFIYLFFYLF